MKRIYLSGPVTGQNPEAVAKAFSSFEKVLSDAGLSVFNPFAYFHDFSRKEEEFGFARTFTEEGIKAAPWEDFMDVALHILMRGRFDAILLLPGWENSKGAKVEAAVAYALKIDVVASMSTHAPDLNFLQN